VWTKSEWRSNIDWFVFLCFLFILDGLGPGNRPNVPDKGILISDGYSNILQNNTVPAADLAKAAGIELYTVVINKDHNLVEMSEVRIFAYLIILNNIFSLRNVYVINVYVYNDK